MNDWDRISQPPARANDQGGQNGRRASVDAEFITAPEWARRVGISDESGYKAARSGQIPGCFLIGRLYRVNWPVFVARAGAGPDRDPADGG